MSGAPGETHPVDVACHDALRGVAEGLRAEAGEPLRDAVAEARRKHRAAREEAGLHRDAPAPERDTDPADLLLAYLEAVEGGAHRTLVDALEAHAPLAALARLLDDARARAGTSVGALPGSVPADRVAGAEAPRGVAGRLARALAGPAARRTVRARWVAERHLAVRVDPGTERWLERAGHAWGPWLASLEAAWARWSAVVLPAIPHPDLPAEEIWAEVASAGAALEAELGRLEGSCPVGRLEGGMEADLVRWGWALSRDLGLAGTALLRGGGPVPSPRAGLDVREAWTTWEAEVVGRFRLQDALLDLVGGVASIPGRTSARLAADLRAPWRRAAVETADALSAEAAEVAGGPAPPALDELRTRTRTLLAELEGELPETGRAADAAGRSADGAVAAVQALVRGLPERVSLHPVAAGEARPRSPSQQGRELLARELGRRAFDALRVERIRTASSAVVEPADSLESGLRAAEEVVTFGFDAAEREAGEGDAEAGARARELVAEALARGADTLRDADARLGEAVEAVRATLHEQLHEGSAILMERALADRLRGRLLDARSTLGTAWARLSGRGASELRRTARAGLLQGARLRREAARLLRRGRRMVAAPSHDESVGTARLLADAEEVREGLPLVYQRLFSWEPLEDETLMAGRDVALAEAEARWERWRREDAVPLVVTARPGVGLTSFFRVFVGRARARGVPVLHDVLEARCIDEAELVARLGSLLGLEGAATLDELADRTLDAPRGSMPDLVVLEGLEHLYLRVPGGTDLLDRFLTFLAETEPRIFWMAGATASAWQMMRVTRPTGVAQVDNLELPGLDEAQLRQAILLRHRRSGVPLRFEEPEHGRRLLRRRLARTRGQEARQALLEQDFFERLHRATRGNLRLAIFQWLRAADVGSGDGSLTIRVLPELDLTFLEGLGAEQHFTLKAFLEHGTLTLDEHDRIFRVPRRESYQILEALGNRHVIQPVIGEGGAEGPRSRIHDDTRYRINPLLQGGVGALLAGRNILH